MEEIRKDKEEEMKWDSTHTLEGVEGEEWVPHMGKPPEQREDEPGQKQTFRSLEVSTAASLL